MTACTWKLKPLFKTLEIPLYVCKMRKVFACGCADHLRQVSHFGVSCTFLFACVSSAVAAAAETPPTRTCTYIGFLRSAHTHIRVYNNVCGLPEWHVCCGRFRHLHAAILCAPRAHYWEVISERLFVFLAAREWEWDTESKHCATAQAPNCSLWEVTTIIDTSATLWLQNANSLRIIFS